MKRVPTQIPSAPSDERGGQAAAVEDASGRDDGHPAADGVDDLGDEREGRDLAGVPAGLGALGHDEVASGIDGTHRVLDLAAHADDDDVVAVAELDDLGRDPEPGHERRGAALDDHLDLLGHAAGHGGEEVDAEGLVGGCAHGRDFRHHLRVAHGGRRPGSRSRRRPRRLTPARSRRHPPCRPA